MTVWSSPEPWWSMELDVRERLEPAAEAGLRLADALRDGADAAAVGRVEVEDAVGLAEADRAEDDGLGLVGASGHGSSSLGDGNGPSRFCVKTGGGPDSDVYDAVVRLLRAGEGAARRERARLRGDLARRRSGASGRRLQQLTGGWTVPQILIDGEPIGGYTELWRLDRDGRLDALLAA